MTCSTGLWAEDQAAVVDGPLVRELLAGQQPDGGFGERAYHKGRGAHWRLVSLAGRQAVVASANEQPR